jgi:hypothetical protein
MIIQLQLSGLNERTGWLYGIHPSSPFAAAGVLVFILIDSQVLSPK